MTDEEIVEALECCNAHRCADCPYGRDCLDHLTGNAIDLINRQQAEIERLSIFNAEIVNRIKTSAIKEFAEELKKHSVEIVLGEKRKYKVITRQGIDRIAERMVGVDNG